MEQSSLDTFVEIDIDNPKTNTFIYTETHSVNHQFAFTSLAFDHSPIINWLLHLKVAASQSNDLRESTAPATA